MDHSSEAGAVAERSSLCPASPSFPERNHLLRPPKNSLCPERGMLLLLEGTPRKGGESQLSVPTGLTPDKGIFCFCQATGMLHYQLPKEYMHKRVCGRIAIGPAQERVLRTECARLVQTEDRTNPCFRSDAEMALRKYKILLERPAPSERVFGA